MRPAYSRCAAVLLLPAVLAGCRLAVITGDGGNVESLSGSRDCNGPDYCISRVDDASFTEDFTAVANPGYEFVKWHDGEGFYCGDSTTDTCSIALGGTAVARAIINTQDTGKIMPLFRYLGLDTDGDGEDNRTDTDDDGDSIADVEDPCPLDSDTSCERGMSIASADTVIVGTREWAQPDLFLGLPPAEMDAVCPNGACLAGGILNGYDMTGWRWAFMYELNELFSHYDASFTASIYAQELYPALPAVLAFIDDGWRSARVGRPEFYLDGYVHGPAYDEEGFFEDEFGAGWVSMEPITYGLSEMRTNRGGGFDNPGWEERGGWFYRDLP